MEKAVGSDRWRGLHIIKKTWTSIKTIGKYHKQVIKQIKNKNDQQM